ncbi:hypothetical protein TGAM01_v204990 [Trichoderma gamsii]|uniref:Nulp1-pending protein n=1 Tax=Trichoderma gamsii TaxID=398673 RepID=A0A2P4ZP47_9HYPO|nr:hypothetical protein TGAM01_v204990 [Trichoderma gamsii]PON26046.1 hypothetical protein TGAM01_v204990 [Trichoderma gamsii]
MSTRQLRKLQKQRELEAKAVQESEGSDGNASDDEIVPVVAKPRPNLFAALGGDDGDGGDESEEVEQEAEAPVSPVDEPAAPAAARKSKKKKKKSKKKAAAAQAQDAEHSEDDEIDRAIRELKIEPRVQDGSSQDNGSALNGILKINPYNLKVANEMRNLFGRDIIESAAVDEEEQRRGTRRRNMPQQMDIETFLKWPTDGRKLPESSRKRNVFIHGRDHWPLRPTGGLSMKELGKTADGTGVEYTYVHNKDYDDVQTMFFVQVQMGDPMRMVYLLKRFPYHVSTLLQVSSVAKQDQNMALSAELCERALFSFGRVALSSFKQNLEHGMARLDFRRPENRQFWLAGYHYIKSLIRKGTYKTALEWAKLLYSLDRSDPYAMRHMIHALALKAHESDWLLDFLSQLDTKGERADSAYLEQSRVLARLQIGDAENARQDIVDGMKKVPWLYSALFQTLNLDIPPSIWGVKAEGGSRPFLTQLYVHQVGDLWNSPEAKSLLEDVAKSIDRADIDKTEATDDLKVDMGLARLIFLNGETSLMGLLPWDVFDQQPNYEFDPLPPAEDDNIFTAEGCRLPWRERQSTRGHPPAALEEFFAQVEELIGQPGRGAIAGVGEEEDGEMLALQRWGNGEAGDFGLEHEQNATDEGLEQDVAGEASESAEDQGLMRRFMQMFGFGRGAEADTTETGGHEAAGEEEEDDDEARR